MQTILDNLCPYLLIASAMENRILTEAVVVNPQDIDRYVAQFARRVAPQGGKDWFVKKLRTALLNSPALMRLVNNPSSNYPPYANAAIEKGEPTYLFDPRLGALEQSSATYEHLTDWFNAMYEIAEREATNSVETEDKVLAQRELSKIMHYNPEQAIAKADAWFKHMGTRAVTTKEGVEIVMKWPTGFYAVRYTDKQTMMSDGQDLQNCLRQGYYWDDVQKGTMLIYGIRKANDEAIVGLRIVAPNTIGEVKGKNNQPVSMEYAQYAADLLNKLHAQGMTHDVAAADIIYHNGRYGTFEDTAEVIYDKDGLKALQGGHKVIVRYQNTMQQIRVGTVLDVLDGDIPADQLLIILNLLRLPPNPTSAQALEKEGIVYNSATKQYGSIADVGKAIASYEGFTSYSLGNRFLLLQGTRRVGSVTVQKRVLTDVSLRQSRTDTIPREALAMFFQSTKMPPSKEAQEYLARLGVLFADNSYITDYGAMMNKLPAVAAKYAVTYEDMPYAWMGEDWKDSMQSMAAANRKPDARWQKQVAALITNSMLPEQTIAANVERSYPVGKTEVRDMAVVIPIAALELARWMVPTVPPKIARHLQVGIKSLLVHMKKHPFDIIAINDNVSTLVLTSSDDLLITIRDHNRLIAKRLKQMLESGGEIPMGSRFAALNAIQRIEDL